MATEKELKYLAKIQGKSAPAVAIEHILETPPPIQDSRLVDLTEAISALQLGVAASIDDDGSVFLGKGTSDGTNHYIIIYPPEIGGYGYAYANQDSNKGEILDFKTLKQAVATFQTKTNPT